MASLQMFHRFLKQILNGIYPSRSSRGRAFSNTQGSDHDPTLKNPKLQTDQTQIKKLLEDAAEEQPTDDLLDDDNWRTSPYPVGSVVNWKQSQAQKSLRPKVDPRETSIILFPGQGNIEVVAYPEIFHEGSQYVGMGKQLLKFPRARDIFEAANEILKFDLLKLMLNGPKEKLDKTKYCQPAVFVCSLAAIEKLKEECPTAIENCMATAGFSVGELAALTFAGVFTFDAGLRLVQVRADAMELASEMTPSGMATVTYGYESKLNQACLKAKEWCIERGIEDPECKIANYISHDMKVVAGNLEALKYLEANEAVYKLESVVKMPEMKGAYHSDIMWPAVKMFKDALQKTEIMEPIISVHSNLDGKIYKNSQQIRYQLPRQIFKPVKWEQTLHILYERSQGAYYPYTYVCGPLNNPLIKYLEKVNKPAVNFCITVDA